MAMAINLKTTDHSREIVGLKYIYPVLSRRSAGLSIGVNFNSNNACNWRCIYCQVPGLTKGAAPEIDFTRLESELRFFLDDVKKGIFFDRFQVPENQRIIRDIAISGNGEPTSLPGFARAVELIGRIATEAGIFPESRFVLITNGSLIHQGRVQDGLKKLNEFNGEVWFKMDSATESGRRLINNAAQSFHVALENLLLSAILCQTKVQTCLVDIDRQGYPTQEREAFLSMLKVIKEHSSVRQILLYTIERPSLQPEAGRLSKLSAETMEAFADEIRAMGFIVSVSR